MGSRPTIIDTSELTRRLYSTDASMYEELPKAVVFPHSEQDLQDAIRKARNENTPITARAAGTSLAGQTTGGGIIVDTSRFMTKILELDPVMKKARVQPGVIRDSLNREAARHGLQFGPDTSTTNRCMIGGMIGNNSSGLYSLRYKTTREHVEEIRAVLSDGSVVVFRPLTPQELDQKCELKTLEGEIYRGMLAILREHKERILEAYPHPDQIRRNTGYALDRLCEMEPLTPGGRPFNLAEILCGSEGTLALTSEAVVRLVDIPKVSILLVSQFETLEDSLHATVELVRHQSSAVELIDHIIIRATEGNIEQRENRFFLKGDPKAVLFTQFDGDTLEEARQNALQAIQALETQTRGYAHDVFESGEEIRRIWDLRKAGLGLLMGLGDDAKTPTFAEDTAVRVEVLPEYIAEFNELLARHNTQSVFYAHASVGELHLRPILNLASEEDRRKMEDMAVEIAHLVKKYRGTLSGEHGDGRARSPFISIVLGEDMVRVLEQVKRLWDPHSLLNPGKIVFAKPMKSGLRTMPMRLPTQTAPTVFKWRREGGFDKALGLCNGAGVCRKLAESGGTMCPSYHVTKEEKDSTRGRANLFRQLFSGEDPKGFDSEDLGEALSLCLSCKACKSECPANVDMARMKAEYQNARHRREGIPFSKTFFGRPERVYGWASKMPHISNAMARTALSKVALKSLAGVDPSRPLPKFAPETFLTWIQREHPAAVCVAPPERFTATSLDSTSNASSVEASRPPLVLLAADLFSNVHQPDVLKATYSVLTKLGAVVCVLPEFIDSGRTRLSQGLLDEMPELVVKTLHRLEPFLEAGAEIVGVEPSELLTFRDEFTDLCEESMLPMAKLLASKSFLLEEWVLRKLESDQASVSESIQLTGEGPVAVHGHCHAKALGVATAQLKALQKAGYSAVQIPAGCCGMAGSFGYELKSSSVSRDIANLRLLPWIAEHKPQRIVAHGFSCRHQIEDLAHLEAVHPAMLLDQAIQSC